LRIKNEYDAGDNLTTCEEKVHNRFKFNGKQYDQVSQQYYLLLKKCANIELYL